MESCGICFEVRDGLKLNLSCGHGENFCSACVTTYIHLKIKDNCVRTLVCPFPRCNNILSKDTIKDIASTEDFESYTRECDELNKVVTTIGVVTLFPSQAFRFVKSFGNEFLSIIRRTVVDAKRCPNCRFVIEKDGGCMHMTCRRCGHEFHWCCGQSYFSAHCGNICYLNRYGYWTLMGAVISLLLLITMWTQIVLVISHATSAVSQFVLKTELVDFFCFVMLGFSWGRIFEIAKSVHWQTKALCRVGMVVISVVHRAHQQCKPAQTSELAVFHPSVSAMAWVTFCWAPWQLLVLNAALLMRFHWSAGGGGVSAGVTASSFDWLRALGERMEASAGAASSSSSSSLIPAVCASLCAMSMVVCAVLTLAGEGIGKGAVKESSRRLSRYLRSMNVFGVAKVLSFAALWLEFRHAVSDMAVMVLMQALGPKNQQTLGTAIWEFRRPLLRSYVGWMGWDMSDVDAFLAGMCEGASIVLNAGLLVGMAGVSIVPGRVVAWGIAWIKERAIPQLQEGITTVFAGVIRWTWAAALGAPSAVASYAWSHLNVIGMVCVMCCAAKWGREFLNSKSSLELKFRNGLMLIVISVLRHAIQQWTREGDEPTPLADVEGVLMFNPSLSVMVWIAFAWAPWQLLVLNAALLTRFHWSAGSGGVSAGGAASSFDWLRALGERMEASAGAASSSSSSSLIPAVCTSLCAMSMVVCAVPALTWSTWLSTLAQRKVTTILGIMWKRKRRKIPTKPKGRAPLCPSLSSITIPSGGAMSVLLSMDAFGVAKVACFAVLLVGFLTCPIQAGESSQWQSVFARFLTTQDPLLFPTVIVAAAMVLLQALGSVNIKALRDALGRLQHKVHATWPRNSIRSVLCLVVLAQLGSLVAALASILPRELNNDSNQLPADPGPGSFQAGEIAAAGMQTAQRSVRGLGRGQQRERPTGGAALLCAWVLGLAGTTVVPEYLVALLLAMTTPISTGACEAAWGTTQRLAADISDFVAWIYPRLGLLAIAKGFDTWASDAMAASLPPFTVAGAMSNIAVGLGLDPGFSFLPFLKGVLLLLCLYEGGATASSFSFGEVVRMLLFLVRGKPKDEKGDRDPDLSIRTFLGLDSGDPWRCAGNSLLVLSLLVACVATGARSAVLTLPLFASVVMEMMMPLTRVVSWEAGNTHVLRVIERRGKGWLMMLLFVLLTEAALPVVGFIGRCAPVLGMATIATNLLVGVGVSATAYHFTYLR